MTRIVTRTRKIRPIPPEEMPEAPLVDFEEAVKAATVLYCITMMADEEPPRKHQWVKTPLGWDFNTDGSIPHDKQEGDGFDVTPDFFDDGEIALLITEWKEV